MYEFLQPGTVLKRRYKVIKVIGGGGMGAVYLSEDTQTRSPIAAAGGGGRRVAVKEMRTDTEDPEDARQNLVFFQREGDLLSTLNNPNLPRVTDYFVEGERHYLVMELIPGESLERKLERLDGKPMPEAEALGYAIQVADVLQYLHTQKPPIIFRDIKPANIMIMPNGQVKLIDFGIARTYKGATQRHDTVAMGTAAYAPYEQFGKGQTDARSDIYSLAATLVHLLTGKPPIPATTPTQASLKALNSRISLPTIRLIIRAMDRNMDKRPATAADFSQELRKALGKPFVAPTSPALSPLPATRPTQESTPQPPQPYRPLSPSPADAALLAASISQPISRSAGQSVFIDPSQPQQSVLINPTPAQIPPEHRPFAPLAGRVCPRCGHTNKPDARFCGSCGLTLAGDISARLIVLGSGGAVMFEQTLPATMQRFTLGRRSPSRNIYPDLDLTYMDPRAYVSRQHAEIRREDGAYCILDTGSENGTYINETRLRPNVAYNLHNGDIVRVGRVQLRFSLAV
jgi:eukaryotic-like serine/threonine-protein kinase